MNCKNCTIETANPKFCSRSCAATYNNKKTPKRSFENRCADCQKPNTKSRTYCKECWRKRVEERSMEKWNEETISSIKSGGNSNTSRYTYIRTMSRRKYLASTRPKICAVCGYSIHIEICHIKSINSFDEDCKIKDVNEMSNLIALCRNHHWEYDNNLLDITPFHNYI